MLTAAAHRRRWTPANPRGMAALARKETWRFIPTAGHTVFGPATQACLFYLVMGAVATGGMDADMRAAWLSFILPGLVAFPMVQTAFINSSSSITISKDEGVFGDILKAPLSPLELVAGYGFGGMMRGLVVGSVALLFLSATAWAGPGAPVVPAHPLALLGLVLLASLTAGLMGAVAGILCPASEPLWALLAFAVTPLAFLSGVFFDIRSLPGLGQQLMAFNPVHYAVEGVRWAMLGRAAVSPAEAAAGMAGADIMLVAIAAWLFARPRPLRL